MYYPARAGSACRHLHVTAAAVADLDAVDDQGGLGFGDFVGFHLCSFWLHSVPPDPIRQAVAT